MRRTQIVRRRELFDADNRGATSGAMSQDCASHSAQPDYRDIVAHTKFQPRTTRINRIFLRIPPVKSAVKKFPPLLNLRCPNRSSILTLAIRDLDLVADLHLVPVSLVGLHLDSRTADHLNSGRSIARRSWLADRGWSPAHPSSSRTYPQRFRPQPTRELPLPLALAQANSRLFFRE